MYTYILKPNHSTRVVPIVFVKVQVMTNLCPFYSKVKKLYSDLNFDGVQLQERYSALHKKIKMGEKAQAMELTMHLHLNM